MIKKNIVVKNGSYTTKDGETKHRYLTIGQVHASQDGGEYITLDAHINLGALPRKEGDNRVTASLYEPRDDNKPKAARSESTLADDVPW
jgi:hypothetical protein